MTFLVSNRRSEARMPARLADASARLSAGARGDVNVLAIVPAQQGDDLSLKAPSTSVCICGKPVSQGGGKPDGACDRHVLGDSGAVHNVKTTKLLFRAVSIRGFDQRSKSRPRTGPPAFRTANNGQASAAAAQRQHRGRRAERVVKAASLASFVKRPNARHINLPSSPCRPHGDGQNRNNSSKASREANSSENAFDANGEESCVSPPFGGVTPRTE